MSYPSDILLPANAKYLAFADQKYPFNPDWDTNWSFEYALSGVGEHGFCTFLSTAPTLSGFPGHYMGYSGTIKLSSYVETEGGVKILSEDGRRLIVEGEDGLDYMGILAIAFDSTGLFALSSDHRSGVGLGSIKRNSLIIRDENDDITFYDHLSNISTDFVLASSGKYFQKLRFRFSDMGNRIHIDYQPPNSSKYNELTSVNITTSATTYPFVYVGFSYCSPISSTTSPSTLYLKNFHVQGNINNTSVEQLPFHSIIPESVTNYTTLCSVSAN